MRGIKPDITFCFLDISMAMYNAETYQLDVLFSLGGEANCVNAEIMATRKVTFNK